MEQIAGREADYRTQYDDYWSRCDRIGESSSDLEQTADQIVMSCGFGRILDVGSGEGGLVAALLRQGVDAHGVDVSKVVVSRGNTRIPSRFTYGSVLSLPFADGSFDTVVSTDCLEHLAPEDISTALREIYRVAKRYVFLKVATTQDRDAHWHLTVEGRAWWEAKCFQAGFRKHAAYHRINTYESLNNEQWQIAIPLEKISASAVARYPLDSLKEERDLHTDMLRESGSRSDAHVARYHWASRFVRPGDAVLDAACGLGYGSHVVRSLTKCSDVTGIDASAYGIDYAFANFSNENSIRFKQGDLPDCLGHLADNSIDSVICFETLEHVASPAGLLAEFHRILTPGGRLIASVPHDWSDETGKDPNPFHLHVYDRSKFIAQLTQFFEIEHLVAQTADRIKTPGAACKWEARPRSFVDLDPVDEVSPVEAEWLLAVTCKSPLHGADIPYVEKVFSDVEQAARGNVLAFARDYENPWLVRSLVSIGLRTENCLLRERWALEVIGRAPVTSADYGAALCVLAYLVLSGRTAPLQTDLTEAIDRYISIESPINPNVFRWQVSLCHVRGLLDLAQGSRDSAKQYFRRVIAFPAASYGPTLLTKPAESAYLLGLLYAADGDLETARSIWQTSFDELQDGLRQRLASPSPALPAGFELSEITTVHSLMARLVSASRSAKHLNVHPCIFHDEVSSDAVARLSWLETQRDAWGRTAAQQDQALADLQAHTQDLLTGNAWLLSQRDAWEQVAAERERSIFALTARSSEADETLADGRGIFYKIRNHWGTRFLRYLSRRQPPYLQRKSRADSMSHRQAVFLKNFDKAEFARFRATYESINPDRPIETANVKFEDTDPRFRQFLEGADESKRSFVDEMIPHLGLFLHGPFPLPGKRVTASAWDCRGKFGAYEAAGIIPKLAGARVLDVGCNAGYDSFLMSSLGAMEVVGLEPHGFYQQACFLNAVYDVPGVSFMNLGWEDLDPRYLGSFDFVNCLGLIYHVKEPMLLIEKLASVMRPGATLVMESHVLSEDSSQSQFIAGAFWGDETYWWVFGAECLMGMLRSAGFKDVRMPLKADCDSRNPLNPRVTVEGHPAGARAWFVATKS